MEGPTKWSSQSGPSSSPTKKLVPSVEDLFTFVQVGGRSRGLLFHGDDTMVVVSRALDLTALFCPQVVFSFLLQLCRCPSLTLASWLVLVCSFPHEFSRFHRDTFLLLTPQSLSIATSSCSTTSSSATRRTALTPTRPSRARLRHGSLHPRCEKMITPVVVNPHSPRGSVG